MYDPGISALALDRTSKSLGFRPEPHPISHCESQIDHFVSLVDENGAFRRPLDEAEIRYIRNERAMCRHDYLYWCNRYAKIIDWTGGLVPYRPNIAQRIMNDVRAEHERLRIAILELVLKARQEGVSTDCEMAVAHRVQFWPHVNAVVASSDPERSALMAQMMERCWTNQPWFLLSEVTEYRAGERIRFGKQDSTVTIQWLNQKTDVGRSGTPTVFHVSEASDCIDPEHKIDAGLIRAVHDSPWLLGVIETTANGQGDWFHKKWLQAVANWPLGRSRLRPQFLPWYVASDLYPTEAWLLAHPIPADWQPAGLTISHAERARSYVKRREDLRRYLGSDWQMPREQMWWWEITREEYRESGNLNTFYQELCADDVEAFQHRATGVFDAELVSTYREGAREPLVCFGLRGNDRDVPLRLQPDRREIDPTRRPVQIKSESGVAYELVPLKLSGYPMIDPNGKILVWEWPQKNELYGFGGDTGYGVGQDRSAIEVMRKGKPDRLPRAVAEFASDRVSATDLAPFCYALGKLFSPTVEGEPHQALAVIECNANGETTQLALRKMGWHRFAPFVRVDRKIIDASRATKLGAFTNAWTRPMVTEYITKVIRDCWLEIDSPWLINEMGQFVEVRLDSGRVRLEAARGAHDDRLMSLAWVFWMLHYLDPNPVIPAFGHRRLVTPGEEKKYDDWTPGWQDRDLPPGADIRTFCQLAEPGRVTVEDVYTLPTQ